VQWHLVRALAPGIVLGGLVGSWGVFAAIKGATLALLFAGFIGFAATQMLLNRQPKASKTLPGGWGLGTVGSVIGLVSGLVGAGGAFISVPYLVAHNVGLIYAVATSAALGFPVALSNAAGLCHQWPGRGRLAAGVFGLHLVAGLAGDCLLQRAHRALGAKVAHAMPVAQLKRIFAGVLYCLAGYMLFKGLRA